MTHQHESMTKKLRGVGLVATSLGVVLSIGVLAGAVITYRQVAADTIARDVLTASFSIQEQVRAATNSGSEIFSLPGVWAEDHLVVDPTVYDDGNLAIYRISVRAYVDQNDLQNVMLSFERPPMNDCARISRRIRALSAARFVTGCRQIEDNQVLHLGFWGFNGGRMAFPSNQNETEASTDGSGGSSSDEGSFETASSNPGDNSGNNSGNRGGQFRSDCWQPFISCSGLGDGTNPGRGSGNNNAAGTPGGDGVTNPGGTP